MHIHRGSHERKVHWGRFLFITVDVGLRPSVRCLQWHSSEVLWCSSWSAHMPFGHHANDIFTIATFVISTGINELLLTCRISKPRSQISLKHFSGKKPRKLIRHTVQVPTVVTCSYRQWVTVMNPKLAFAVCRYTKYCRYTKGCNYDALLSNPGHCDSVLIPYGT